MTRKKQKVKKRVKNKARECIWFGILSTFGFVVSRYATCIFFKFHKFLENLRNLKNKYKLANFAVNKEVNRQLVR